MHYYLKCIFDFKSKGNNVEENIAEKYSSLVKENSELKLQIISLKNELIEKDNIVKMVKNYEVQISSLKEELFNAIQIDLTLEKKDWIEIESHLDSLVFEGNIGLMTLSSNKKSFVKYDEFIRTETSKLIQKFETCKEKLNRLPNDLNISDATVKDLLKDIYSSSSIIRYANEVSTKLAKKKQEYENYKSIIFDL